MNNYSNKNDGFIPENNNEAAEPIETPKNAEQPQSIEIDSDPNTNSKDSVSVNSSVQPKNDNLYNNSDTVNNIPTQNAPFDSSAEYNSQPQYGVAPQWNPPVNCQPTNQYYNNMPVNTNSNQQYPPNTSYSNIPPYQPPSYGGGFTQSPVPPPKNKMSNGVKALIIGIIVLLFLFVVGIGVFALSTFISRVNGEHSNSVDYSSSFINDGNSSNDVFAGDPNGPSIDLKDAPSNNSSKNTAQGAYKKVSPSVVGVLAYNSTSEEITENTQGSQGTGIIISSNGYIVTNSHVIGNSKSYTVKIVLPNTKDEIAAKVVGFDTRTDLAVLKIEKQGLTPAEFSDSDKIEIGQDVIAIGNPGGIEYSNSITRGIISAVNRSVSSSNVPYIQTDAAINPGNSGGPLCNLEGRVIGINTIKVVNTEFEGMGFAIPSKEVKSITDDLIKQGYISGRVKIGITGKEITSTESELFSIPRGLVISDFSSESPLPRAGAKIKDIITSIDGTKIASFNEFYTELAKHSPGDKVTLTLYRINEKDTKKGEEFNIDINLIEDKGDTPPASSNNYDNRSAPKQN